VSLRSAASGLLSFSPAAFGAAQPASSPERLTSEAVAMSRYTRASVRLLDLADPLAQMRDLFYLPRGIVYLDGNSLGALPRSTRRRLNEVIQKEWGERLIRSWNESGWIEAPQRVGDKIARLIGAQRGEVIVADSTSINLFKTLAAALALRPDRRVILSTLDNFPTDLYIAQGLIKQLGMGHELRLVAGDELAESMSDDVAALMLTHINYQSGRILDMPGLTRKAHEHGALALWDLSHSAGALPVDLGAADADLAVGCGYKYLNGGPGAPAFLYVAERHQASFSQPLSGWMGHAQPFAFVPDYAPAEGVARYLCGTPAMLSLAALECGVDLLLEAEMARIREKSLALTTLFIDLVESRLRRFGLELLTPLDTAIRGSQVSFRHPEGYAMMQALIHDGVIGDFRTPDIMRFGFTPLYLRYVDVWDAVTRLRRILVEKRWDQPAYQRRQKVT
jgi:kynureninase